ncbi:substrate-binding periplasmic protein [Mariprofundus ferrooxydans]|uniref:substrate-binding periplasmic protein n=1 Tax=Mariprofundus ferrooxydans TaxID=314344 RepID=UPI001430943F|nr:transporter substrate-binding domain-containing protein [Mariprofundus ferrooxydans]
MRLWLAPVLAAMLLSGSPALAASVVLDANESPPYWSESMAGSGMCNEIVQAISRAAGISSVLSFKPLQRMIAEDDNNDLGNPDFYLRNQDFAAIIPIAIYYVDLFYYKPNHAKAPGVVSLADLKGFKVGILKGTLVDRTGFARAGIDVEESYSQEALFRKLRKGRIDLVVEVDLVGRQMIRKLFPDEVDAFVADPLEKSEAPIAILLSQQQPDVAAVAQAYRRGLRTIMASGEYRAIVEKYYGAGLVPEYYYHDLDRFTRLYHFVGGTSQ